jgi:hypothetical protein
VTTIAGLSPAMCTVLQAVGDGQVRCDVGGPRKPSYHLGWHVTATVDALHRRQLITPGEREDGRRYSTWVLTDAGRALLARLDGVR